MAASTQSMCQYWKDFDLQDLQVTFYFLLILDYIDKENIP